MKREKKRWAWKPKHKRPCFKQHCWAPPSSWYYLRQFWSGRRVKETEGLRVVLADPEADYPFPQAHRHSLAWTWC